MSDTPNYYQQMQQAEADFRSAMNKGTPYDPDFNKNYGNKGYQFSPNSDGGYRIMPDIEIPPDGEGVKNTGHSINYAIKDPKDIQVASDIIADELLLSDQKHVGIFGQPGYEDSWRASIRIHTIEGRPLDEKMIANIEERLATAGIEPVNFDGKTPVSGSQFASHADPINIDAENQRRKFASQDNPNTKLDVSDANARGHAARLQSAPAPAVNKLAPVDAPAVNKPTPSVLDMLAEKEAFLKKVELETAVDNPDVVDASKPASPNGVGSAPDIEGNRFSKLDPTTPIDTDTSSHHASLKGADLNALNLAGDHGNIANAALQDAVKHAPDLDGASAIAPDTKIEAVSKTPNGLVDGDIKHVDAPRLEAFNKASGFTGEDVKLDLHGALTGEQSAPNAFIQDADKNLYGEFDTSPGSGGVKPQQTTGIEKVPTNAPDALSHMSNNMMGAMTGVDDFNLPDGINPSRGMNSGMLGEIPDLSGSFDGAVGRVDYSLPDESLDQTPIHNSSPNTSPATGVAGQTTSPAVVVAETSSPTPVERTWDMDGDRPSIEMVDNTARQEMMATLDKANIQYDMRGDTIIEVAVADADKLRSNVKYNAIPGTVQDMGQAAGAMQDAGRIAGAGMDAVEAAGSIGRIGNIASAGGRFLSGVPVVGSLVVGGIIASDLYQGEALAADATQAFEAGKMSSGLHEDLIAYHEKINAAITVDGGVGMLDQTGVVSAGTTLSVEALAKSELDKISLKHRGEMSESLYQKHNRSAFGGHTVDYKAVMAASDHLPETAEGKPELQAAIEAREEYLRAGVEVTNENGRMAGRVPLPEEEEYLAQLHGKYEMAQENFFSEMENLMSNPETIDSFLEIMPEGDKLDFVLDLAESETDPEQFEQDHPEIAAYVQEHGDSWTGMNMFLSSDDALTENPELLNAYIKERSGIKTEASSGTMLASAEVGHDLPEGEMTTSEGNIPAQELADAGVKVDDKLLVAQNDTVYHSPSLAAPQV